jgi:hypothetical protein
MNGTSTGGEWGVDNVYFGNNAMRDLGLASQFVVGVKTADFFVGSFGLAWWEMSYMENTQTTLLNTLFKARVSPSYSVSDTASSAKSRIRTVIFAQ